MSWASSVFNTDVCVYGPKGRNDARTKVESIQAVSRWEGRQSAVLRLFTHIRSDDAPFEKLSKLGDDRRNWHRQLTRYRWI